MVLLATVLLPACDCFFTVAGQVTDCATGTPVAGVVVDVHVDRGYRDRMESFPAVTTTGADGHYTVGLNDPCESWATLTFHRDGYTPVTAPQIQGHSDRDEPVNACLEAAVP